MFNSRWLMCTTTGSLYKKCGKTATRNMSTSRTLSVDLLLNCSKLFGSKLHNFSYVGSQALSSISVVTAFDRVMLCPAPHSYLWMRQHCLHSKTSRYTSMRVRSAAYSSLSPTDEPEPDSDFKESAQIPRKFSLSKEIRTETLHRRSQFQEIISGKGDAAWTDNDWLEVSEKLSSDKSLWDVLCMQKLYTDKNIRTARSLMEYLEKQPNKPSMVVLTFFTGLLGETSSGSEEQENETYRYYQLILSETDVLDAATIEVLICGLSMTRHYRECLHLLKMREETSSANTPCLVIILRAGLRNKDMDICSFILGELEEKTELSSLPPFMPKVIDECLAVDNKDGLEMVMNFIQKHRLLLPRSGLENITEAFNRYQPNQWRAKYTLIHHRDGHCVACGHQMKRLEVSDEDFESIKTAFLDQVIVGSNVFFKSSPEEVNTFVKFVKKTGPFDVVIDGMNVMYVGGKKPDFEKLEKTVEHFSSQKNKVLVLGSKMLLAYLSILKKMVPKPAIYLTTTTKADDAFFLYAALHSGKNTLVVTNDKLRDHRFLLKRSLRHIFHHWLVTIQVHSWFFSRENKFIIKRRHIFNIGPVKDDGGWHIPENDVDSENPHGKLSVLCLRNGTSQTSYKRPDISTSRHPGEGLQQASFRKYVDEVNPNQERIKSAFSRKTGANETGSLQIRADFSKNHNSEEIAASYRGLGKKNFTESDKTKVRRMFKTGAAEGKRHQASERNIEGEKEWFDV